MIPGELLIPQIAPVTGAPTHGKHCPTCGGSLVSTPNAGPNAAFYCPACDRAFSEADV